MDLISENPIPFLNHLTNYSKNNKLFKGPSMKEFYPEFNDSIRSARMRRKAMNRDIGPLNYPSLMRRESFNFKTLDSFNQDDKPERTEMITAIISNNIVTVRKLIENQEALNIVNRNGHSYLHLSAYFNKVEITQILIKAGLKVDSRDHHYLTPLHSACSNNSSNVVKLLIERGADLNARDQNWLTPLHICAANNSLECLNHLNRNPVYLNVTDSNGSTALHYSASKGYYDFTDNLLKNGADPKLKDNNDRTCLHYSVINGDCYTISLIVDQNIDIDSKDKKGLTALHIACIQLNWEAVELLINRGANVNEIDNDGNSALHHSCFKKGGLESGIVEMLAFSNETGLLGERNRICKFLIDKGANLEAQNNQKLTPLHMVHCEGPITDAYSRLKLNFNCRDHLDRTPMHIICYKGLSHLIDIFIENGADIRARDKFNRTPLHYAIEYSQYKCIIKLISIDPNLIGMVDNNNCNGLHYAASLSFDNGIWYKLVEIYPNFDQKDNFGRTYHFYGAQSEQLLKNSPNLPSFLDHYNRNLLFYTLCHLGCSTKMGQISNSGSNLEYILSIKNLKLDINQRDIYGRTPLHYACLLKLKRHFDCLLENFASLYIEDNKGLTPIHYIILIDSSNTLRELIEAGLIDLNQSRYKICLMQCAAYFGSGACLKLLMMNLYKNHSSLTKSLEYAIWNGQVHCVEIILSQMVKTNTIGDLYNGSALNLAALKSDFTCFDRLMVNLEKSDIRDEHGRTTMMFALINCKNRNRCIQSILQRSDCDLNVVDNEHRNVLFYSVLYENIEMVSFFIQIGVNMLQKCLSGQTIFHLAAIIGNIEMFKLILMNLKNRMNIAYDQLLDNEGFNPLHYACYKGNPEIINMLIQSFPDKNHSIITKDKISYLHLASYSGNKESIKLIIEQFGQQIINQIDLKGRNALHYLCMSKLSNQNPGNSTQLDQINQHSSIISSSMDQVTFNESSIEPYLEINHKLASFKLLLDNKIDINCEDKYGKTPLMIAIQNGETKLSLCLIDELKIDLQIKDRNGSTALHYACKFKNELIGQKLIKKDTTLVNLIDNQYRSALHLASSNGLLDLVKCLLSSGASCFLQDSFNFTPALSCAKNNDVADCLDLLIEVMIFEKSQNDTNISSSLVDDKSQNDTNISSSLVDKESIRCSSPIIEARKSLISQWGRRPVGDDYP